MSEKRFVVETVAVRDKVITDKEKYYSYEDLDEIVDKLNEQQSIIEQLEKENKQLRIQLLICQQSKNDDGRFKVWEVPPITIGTKITTSTTFNGDKNEI